MFNALQSGDCVGIIALSNWIEAGKLEAGEAEIRRAGFTPVVHPNTLLRHGRFAGTDEQRLQALHDMYADERIKAIICARGGYGITRIIDRVDFELIKRNPKPLIGYSDVTALLNPVVQRTGQPALLGPMLVDLARHDSPDSWASLWQLLRGEPVLPGAHSACQAAEALVAGEAEGILLGGNLAVLCALFGTPTQPDYRGAVLVLEDVGEDLYRFDRMMGQMARAGVFSQVRGVIMGELVDVADKGEPAFGQTVREVAESYLLRLGIPVVWNFPCGHGCHRVTLPLGVPARLSATKEGVTLSHDRIFD